MSQVSVLNIAIPVTGIIGCFVSGQLLKKFSRETLLWYGDLCCCITLATMGLYIKFLEHQPDSVHYQQTILVSLFLYLFSFNISLGPVFWVLSSP
jgi:hypothetical protein